MTIIKSLLICIKTLHIQTKAAVAAIGIGKKSDLNTKKCHLGVMVSCTKGGGARF